MTDDLAKLAADLRAHLAEPFPESVRGEYVVEVDAVMIAADIVGWASTVSGGSALPGTDRSHLRQAADELDRSLATSPAEARPYYERVLRIARMALASRGALEHRDAVVSGAASLRQTRGRPSRVAIIARLADAAASSSVLRQVHSDRHVASRSLDWCRDHWRRRSACW